MLHEFLIANRREILARAHETLASREVPFVAEAGPSPSTSTGATRPSPVRAPEPLDFLAHEMRNLLTTAMLSFDALRRGSVGMQGSTASLLARNLERMRTLIDRTLGEVHLGAGARTPDSVSIAGPRSGSA